jgi:hypothetical protein
LWKNQDRLLNEDIAPKLSAAILNLLQVRALMASKHLSLDGTLTEVWRAIIDARLAEASVRTERVTALDIVEATGCRLGSTEDAHRDYDTTFAVAPIMLSR